LADGKTNNFSSTPGLCGKERGEGGGDQWSGTLSPRGGRGSPSSLSFLSLPSHGTKIRRVNSPSSSSFWSVDTFPYRPAPACPAARPAGPFPHPPDSRSLSPLLPPPPPASPQRREVPRLQEAADRRGRHEVQSQDGRLQPRRPGSHEGSLRLADALAHPRTRPRRKPFLSG